MKADLVAVVISIISLGWSIFNGWKIRKQQIEVNALTIEKGKKEVDLEKMADLHAVAFNNGKTYQYAIRITNKGKASATNITIDWMGVMDRISGISINEAGKLPFPILNPGDYFDIYANVVINHDATPVIELHWNDGYKDGNMKKTALNF